MVILIRDFNHTCKFLSCVCVCVCVCVCAQSLRFFTTPWTIAHQASLSMKFSRQEYWSGLPFPPPRDPPNPGIKLASLASAGRFFTTALPGGPWYHLPTIAVNALIGLAYYEFHFILINVKNSDQSARS